MIERNFSEIANFTDKQKEVIKAIRTGGRYILYGGSLGSGKSYLLRWVCAWRLMELASRGLKKVVVMLACEDYPSLKDRQVSKIEKEFPPWMGKMHGDHRTYGLCYVMSPQCGRGVIVMRNLDDAAKYQSSEFAMIAVDELTKNNFDTFTFLRTRMRWPGLKDDDMIFIGATNPGGPGHCVRHGEVMTPKGFVDIKDVKVGDDVFSVSPSLELVVRKVEQVHKDNYSGDMIKVKAGGLIMDVTPNHKVAQVTDNRRNQTVNTLFTLVPFQSLPGQVSVLRSVRDWNGTEIDSFSPRHVEGQRDAKLEQPTSLSGDEYCIFMGWIISEGSTCGKLNKAFFISQKKPQMRAKLKLDMDRMGFIGRWYKDGFVAYSIDWWTYIRRQGRCPEKYVPQRIKNATKKQLRIFFDTMMDGDGHWSGSKRESGQYYTISKRLADDMVEICVKLGYITYVTQRKRSNRHNTAYDVSFKNTQSGGTELITGNHVYAVETSVKRRSDITREHYEGPVYCIGVQDTHNFLLRQNGSVWVSGNSWVKQLWIDRNFGDEWREPIDLTERFKFIPARGDDNPHLDAAYWQTLNTLPENMRKAFRDGSWDIFVGQAFPEFMSQTHIVKPDQSRPPSDCRHYMMAIDWGFGAPFSVLWAWVDTAGRIIICDEWYGWNGQVNQGLRLSDDEIARGISKREESNGFSGKPVVRLGGSDCFRKKPDYRGGGQGPSTADIFGINGLTLRPADDNRILKLRAFRGRIAKAVDGKPRLLVSSSCKEFIRTVQGIVQDENNPEEIDTRGEDHCLDAACHFCMSRVVDGDKTVVSMGAVDNWVI